MKLRMGLWLSPLILALGGCGYNTIQQYDENAQQAKQQISVQLQRRADLVPNLVNTVKGYAQHEEAVFTQVATARGALTGRDSGRGSDANGGGERPADWCARPAHRGGGSVPDSSRPTRASFGCRTSSPAPRIGSRRRATTTIRRFRPTTPISGLFRRRSRQR